MSAPGPFVPITRPALDEREAEAVKAVLLSGWVTQGPQVAAFEEEFAAFVGAPHACAVSSCTAALHLALHALGVGPGDEVVTVSHSFIATANAIRYCGALPVFVDIEPATYNIDPDKVEAAIGPRTRAILCVHQMGMPCDLGRLLAIAERHGLPLVEDAACAVGSEILLDGAWQRIGKPHGLLACFSFHPRKLVTTGDGGMITTADAALAGRLRRLRQHGMSVSDTVRHGAREVIFESYEELGFNYRLTDIQAAVGRVQLGRLDGMVARRRALAARYRERLSGVPGLGLPQEPDWARSNWQTYCLGLAAGLEQRAVMQALLDAGIASRRGIMCAHREPAYRAGGGGEPWSCRAGVAACDCGPEGCARLAESEAAQDGSIAIPLYEGLSEADQDRVIEVLLAACAGRRGSAA